MLNQTGYFVKIFFQFAKLFFYFSIYRKNYFTIFTLFRKVHLSGYFFLISFMEIIRNDF